MGKEAPYKSPTDMGVNRAGFGIINDDAVREAARQEVIRRHLRHRCEYVMGLCDQETEQRAAILMDELNVKVENRKVVEPARQAAADAEKCGKGHEGICCGAAIQLRDGSIVTGKNSPLMHAAASVVLNAAKHLAEVPDRVHLLARSTLDSIGHFKGEVLSSKNVSLSLEEALIALSVSASQNPTAELALEKLKELSGCEMHMTHIPTPGDDAGLRRLGINLTSDPDFATKQLFVG
jgi:uncharacterized protein (UPF0371 family)